MNAHCSTLEDDLTLFGFGAGSNDPYCDDACGDESYAQITGGAGGDFDPDAWLEEAFDDDFESLDAVERHGLRRMTSSHAQQWLADRAADSAGVGLAKEHAEAILVWNSDQLPQAIRRRLVDRAGAVEGGSATSWLAAWRGGGMGRRELSQAAGDLLEAARVDLALERETALRVIEGPWRKSGTSVTTRVHELHLLQLAVRHGDLELDATGEQIAEMWLEELRSELRARLRELQAGSATADDLFAETAQLLAAISEMWRDTAPAGKPIRLPLERLTRVAWVVGQQRQLSRAERASLLIAAANQRLDDLWIGSFEGPLYTGFADGASANATWVGGRRPQASDGTDAVTEALVLRALSGPARTGPRRFRD